MATAITAAGERLIAELQAAGEPLVIDRFIFAGVAGQNPSDPIAPGTGVPLEDVVFAFDIPNEYRAFVNPNQVVYSALLGSGVGDFTFNWQGLYCSAHGVLVAVSTFPAVEKRKTDAASGQSGNNITRNFIIEFTGAKEATAITVAASTWQLDFSVRLAGIDERERLSNRDLHGRASFMADGWALVKEGGDYRFSPGVGYVEGIRLALAEALLLPAPALPCSVWLDVALEPSGSDVAAVVAPISAGPDDELADYTTAAPFYTRHYLEKVATIDAGGNIVDGRSASSLLASLAKGGHAGDIFTTFGEGVTGWNPPAISVSDLDELSAELDSKIDNLPHTLTLRPTLSLNNRVSVSISTSAATPTIFAADGFFICSVRGNGGYVLYVSDDGVTWQTMQLTPGDLTSGACAFPVRAGQRVRSNGQYTHYYAFLIPWAYPWI